MKRFTAILILVVMLLCGCNRVSNPVNFYYISKDYQTTLLNTIDSEKRDASGHDDDLSYLLALYLMGPADDSLRSPLPVGIQIQVIQNSDGSIDLNLPDTTRTLSDSDFSLACACLTLTCLDIIDASSVNIISGSRSVTMDRNNLTLFDNYIDIPSTEENT